MAAGPQALRLDLAYTMSNLNQMQVGHVKGALPEQRGMTIDLGRYQLDSQFRTLSIAMSYMSMAGQRESRVKRQ